MRYITKCNKNYLQIKQKCREKVDYQVILLLGFYWEVSNLQVIKTQNKERLTRSLHNKKNLI